jgi:predicted phosphodiesterase
MKTLLIADSHRRTPLPFIRNMISEGKAHRTIFLGDVDEPSILEDLIKLESEKIILTGNHEYPFLHSFKNGRLHRSIDCFGFSDEEIQRYYKYWHSSQTLSEYAKNWHARFYGNEENGLGYQEKSRAGNILYIHGLPYAPRIAEDFSCKIWGCLKPQYGKMQYNLLMQNFIEMQEKDYWIIFRGHDHQRDMQSIGKNDNPFKTGAWEANLTTSKSGIIQLEDDRRYIITVGAFTWGGYMVFDSKNLKLEWGEI